MNREIAVPATIGVVGVVLGYLGMGWWLTPKPVRQANPNPPTEFYTVRREAPRGFGR